ncbi:hypothetical protein [Streptomyces mirabilis]|uniref:hypothetical protein n=1 Tax=Streptomyces mirabilis TaxID=68239 RepID=UPI0036E6A345
MQLTIDTETDTYEQAIAAVQAAYKLRPVTPAGWPEAPAPDPRPDPLDLAEDDLGDGWSDRALFQVIAGLVPGARAVLRRITDLGGTASYDGIQQYFATHPTSPIPRSRIGGTLTSVKAVQRRAGLFAPCCSGTNRPGYTASTGPWWKVSAGLSLSRTPVPTCCAARPPTPAPELPDGQIALAPAARAPARRSAPQRLPRQCGWTVGQRCPSSRVGLSCAAET